MNSVSRLAAATAATLLMGHAQATTVLHTSWISFLDAIEGGAYVETFNRLDSSVEPSSFSGLGYSYNMSAPGGLYASSTDVGTNLPEETLTINFTGGTVSAVGGQFYATDINPDFLPEAITITLGDGSFVTYAPASKTSFVGFTSSMAITSLKVEFADVWLGRYATVDNLTVGAALVPEPGQWALLAAGLAALGMLQRRRSA
jgi:hypothetical protein